MPERYLAEGDPYHCHCRKTTRLLRDRLGFAENEVTVTFQSKFGPEEWLKPYTVDEVARLAAAGTTRIAIMAPAFSSDCVETLEEINGEIQHSFRAAGGLEFTYIPVPQRRRGAYRHDRVDPAPRDGGWDLIRGIRRKPKPRAGPAPGRTPPETPPWRA